MRIERAVLFLGAALLGGAAAAETADVRIAWGSPKKTTRTKELMTRHDALAADVFLTTFGDGSTIVSNYGATPYDWEGDSVPPLGYLLRNPDGSIRR